MNLKESNSTIAIVLIASIILALAVSIKDHALLTTAFISFLVIISLNILAKKSIGHYFETNIKTKFWSLYQFGFKKRNHFKSPIYMAWLPLLLSLVTQGIVLWLAIIEFDVSPKAERASKRHGLYRFSQVTEWHMGLIAVAGLIINLLAGIIGYILGYETFAKLSIYFATWSMIPFSSLDGSKIFFSSRILWTILFFIIIILFGWALII
jgi:hypothetical protein